MVKGVYESEIFTVEGLDDMTDYQSVLLTSNEMEGGSCIDNDGTTN